MTLRAIKRQSTQSLVAEELRAQITGGDLLPGARLLETVISEQLGVSRGTLRVALHQLSKEGLIVQTPYTGWAVATIAPEDLWELYTLRAGLESMAARLACEQLDSEDSKSLEKAFAALLTACAGGRYATIAEKDFDLHKKIIELAKHRRLAEHYRLVEQQIRIFVATTYHFVSAPASVIDHHEPIVKAILRRDADAASDLISDHAISEGRKLHDYLVEQARIAAADGQE
ncbi:GntR family transcriptional regulator [Bradyrhizobium liaoningense]